MTATGTGDAGWAFPTAREAAVDWQAQALVPRRLRGGDPVVVQRAYRRARGAWGRLELGADGSVTVRNEPAG